MKLKEKADREQDRGVIKEIIKFIKDRKSDWRKKSLIVLGTERRITLYISYKPNEVNITKSIQHYYSLSICFNIQLKMKSK